MTLKELSNKLENLHGQCMETNLDIMKFMEYADENNIVDGDCYTNPKTRHHLKVINYTGSIDKALTLIPKGWGMVGLEKCGNEWACELALGGEQHAEHRYTDSHKVASIAILNTIFKLKQYISEE
jgi:hypothetical protein